MNASDTHHIQPDIFKQLDLAEGDFFRALIDLSPDAFVIIAPSGPILWANPRALEMYGFPTLDDALDSSVSAYDLFDDASRDRARRSVEDIMRSSESMQGGYIARLRNGATLPVEIHARALNDAAGKPVALLASIRDDSERAVMMEQLEAQRRLLDTIIEAIPDEIYVKDLNHTFIHANGACVHALGQQSRDDVLGKRDRDLIASIWADLSEAEEQRVIASGEALRNEPGRLRIDKETGTVERAILISKMPLRDADGTIRGIVGVNRDVTEWRRAEAAMMRSQRRLALALEGARCGILEWNTELDKVEISDQLGRLLGRPASSLEGSMRKVLRILEPDDLKQLRAAVVSIFAGQESRIAVELRARRGDGATIWLSFIGTVVERGEAGNVLRISGIVLDVTERKQGELELLAAKERAESSDRVKNAFIANISHEIRTPLNTISGYAQHIQEVFADRIKPGEAKYFESIQRGGERLMRTVDEILNLSRIQSGEMRLNIATTDLNALLHHVISEMRQKAQMKSLTLTFVNECGHLEIEADEYYLSQAVLNLVDNAIKYTDRGTVRVRMFRSDNSIMIEVRDTGIGMSPDFLSRMYEPYSQEQIGHTRQHEGIGLGLALVQKYLEFHHATISVESTKGEGSAFTIRLPWRPAESTGERDRLAPGPSKTRRRGAHGKFSILVVEDDPMTLDYLSLILGSHFAISTASTASDAWRILRRKHIDIVLMDIALRGKKTGLDLTREIRRSDSHATLPIIALTAHAFPEDKDACLIAGCNSFVAKPAGKTTLLDAIERLLSETSSR